MVGAVAAPYAECLSDCNVCKGDDRFGSDLCEWIVVTFIKTIRVLIFML